jgi:hypothetical protein
MLISAFHVFYSSVVPLNPLGRHKAAMPPQASLPSTTPKGQQQQQSYPAAAASSNSSAALSQNAPRDVLKPSTTPRAHPKTPRTPRTPGEGSVRPRFSQNRIASFLAASGLKHADTFSNNHTYSPDTPEGQHGHSDAVQPESVRTSSARHMEKGTPSVAAAGGAPQAAPASTTAQHQRVSSLWSPGVWKRMLETVSPMHVSREPSASYQGGHIGRFDSPPVQLATPPGSKREDSFRAFHAPAAPLNTAPLAPSVTVGGHHVGHGPPDNAGLSGRLLHHLEPSPRPRGISVGDAVANINAANSSAAAVAAAAANSAAAASTGAQSGIAVIGAALDNKEHAALKLQSLPHVLLRGKAQGGDSSNTATATASYNATAGKAHRRVFSNSRVSYCASTTVIHCKIECNMHAPLQ